MNYRKVGIQLVGETGTINYRMTESQIAEIIYAMKHKTVAEISGGGAVTFFNGEHIMYFGLDSEAE